jgi:hypothetical protein
MNSAAAPWVERDKPGTALSPELAAASGPTSTAGNLRVSQKRNGTVMNAQCISRGADCRVS